MTTAVFTTWRSTRDTEGAIVMASGDGFGFTGGVDFE